MDKILIISPRASSAPALGLNTIIFKYVYWYMKQISGERLQDHWSSGLFCNRKNKNQVSLDVALYKNNAIHYYFMS